MKRSKDDFLANFTTATQPKTKTILEIGCGDGRTSVLLAPECQRLVGVEPDSGAVQLAQAKNIPNATFMQGSAESLPKLPDVFDIVLFSLSFHHVPIHLMGAAIEQAVSYTADGGLIVFHEPTVEGSFFTAEIQFDFCDGDERREKEAAQKEIQKNSLIKVREELDDTTVFESVSKNDLLTLGAKKNISEIPEFLKQEKHELFAKRKLTVCSLA